jgi:hypothetical protein
MSTAEGSERTSDRLLAAFLVGAAGPLTGLLAVLLLPFPTSEGTGDLTELPGLMAETMAALLLVVLVVLPLMAIATFVAFVLTGASHPFLAGIAAVVLAPVWNWVVEALPLPGLPAYLAVLGLLPATIRFLVPTRTPRPDFRPLETDPSG